MNRDEWLKSLKAGDTVYIKGMGFKHINEFEKCFVAGETTRSFLVLPYHQIDKDRTDNFWTTRHSKKNGGGASGTIYSKNEIEDIVWMSKNQYAIGNHVMRIQDCDVLRKIAEMIGYVPKGEGE